MKISLWATTFTRFSLNTYQRGIYNLWIIYEPIWITRKREKREKEKTLFLVSSSEIIMWNITFWDVNTHAFPGQSQKIGTPTSGQDQYIANP
jgi:hypothetical protein